MSVQDGYAWYVAVVWPDSAGRPTVRIYDWDIDAGKFTGVVDSFTYGSSPSFYEIIESKYYEAVEGMLSRSVTHNWFQVALRRETVPVRVRA